MGRRAETRRESGGPGMPCDAPVRGTSIVGHQARRAPAPSHFACAQIIGPFDEVGGGLQQCGEGTRGVLWWFLGVGVTRARGRRATVVRGRSTLPALLSAPTLIGALAPVPAPRADASPGGEPSDGPSAGKGPPINGAPRRAARATRRLRFAPGSPIAPSRDVHGSGGPPAATGARRSTTTGARRRGDHLRAHDPRRDHHIRRCASTELRPRRMSGRAR